MSKKNILIIHGFMHSKNRYYKLCKDLKIDRTINIYFFKFNGFGGILPVKDKNKLNYYAEKLTAMLHKNKYDLIIAHSMGCNVLLKSIAKNQNVAKNIILLSPCYNGIKKFKPLSICIPFSSSVFFYSQNYQYL